MDTIEIEIIWGEVAKKHNPNWYIYDLLKKHSFPMELKENICQYQKARFIDLDFKSVKLTGCFETEDFTEPYRTVYKFKGIKVVMFRNTFSRNFA